MNVVFLAPDFPSSQRQFVRALAESGAVVIGIGESALDELDEQLKGWMYHYEHVSSLTDVEAITAVVRRAQGSMWVDRLEATIETQAMAAAQVREVCRIPGVSVRTAWLCRDKASMKQALREVGVPIAASTAAKSTAEVRTFADQFGFPLILKPGGEAGAADTMRVDGTAELDRAVGLFGGQGVGSIAVEEFIEGHEGFYDTLTVDGQVALDFVSHCYPNVLDALHTRWISPQLISTNRLDTAPEYTELRDMSRLVNVALGIGTSATHMEWFYGRKGLKFSAIGYSPPGDGAWDLYSAGNDIDLHREWANAIVGGRAISAPSRRFASGLIAVRPDNDGHITGYSGLDELHQRYGGWIIDARLPPPGTATRAVEAGYLANAYLRMRHPDSDTLHAMLDDVGRTLHVYAA